MMISSMHLYEGGEEGKRVRGTDIVYDNVDEWDVHSV